MGLPWLGTMSASLSPLWGAAKATELLVQPLWNVFNSRQSLTGSGCEEQPCPLWGQGETGQEMLQGPEQGFPCAPEEQGDPERLQPIGVSFSPTNSVLIGQMKLIFPKSSMFCL